jgi:hypothetical protein
MFASALWLICHLLDEKWTNSVVHNLPIYISGFETHKTVDFGEKCKIK